MSQNTIEPNRYKESLARITLGYVFIYFNINIGPVSAMPAWIGFILILTALDAVAEREPSAALLNPFAFVLIIGELIQWVLPIFDGSIDWTWYHLLLSVIGLYFHFQLLTNLSDVGRRFGSAYWKRLRFFRTYQTIFITVLAFTDIGVVNIEDGIGAIILVALLLIMVVGIVWTLYRYKQEPEIRIEIPSYVQKALDELNDRGYEAYVVGGCVRDVLMGKEPHDWDVCTSALPEETKDVFFNQRTIDTGLKHGTVTVLIEDNPIEITTYRIDGDYKDGRHPEQVEFTRSLREDLARRDFTINAMAYHPSKGVIDIYHGREDLQAGRIRCVGDPNKRFSEDALRIMRGLRFASTLYFSIEPATAEAMHKEKERLQAVSRERINVELSKLLLGRRADQILIEYMEILETAAPGIVIPQTDLNQLPENLAIRLAEVFPKDTGRCLRELKYDGNTVRWARVLARIKDKPVLTESKKEMVRFLQKHGETITILHYARAGKTEVTALYELLKEQPCYRTSDLAISGEDLMKAGIQPGPKMGELIKTLLELVIEEQVENEKDALLDAVKFIEETTKAAKEEIEHE